VRGARGTGLSRFAQAESRAFGSVPAEVISEAEFVWYQDGREHAEILPLRGRP
jgi:hypothetical protein